MSLEYNLEEDEFRELKKVIKEFLSKYKYLYEIRIQKLVYYAELYSLENYGVRITKSNFKPFHYGSFSETVRDALQDLDLPTKTVRTHGKVTKRYLNYGVESPSLSQEKKKVIDRVHERTRSTSTEELAKLSKDSWLFNNFNKGDEMTFADYKEYLVDKFDIDPDGGWREELQNSNTDGMRHLQFYDEKAPLTDSDGNISGELASDGGFYRTESDLNRSPV